MKTKTKDENSIFKTILAVGLSASLASCGSAYSNIPDRHGTGANQYRPAVDYAVSGKTEAQYNDDLLDCRRIAQTRQATASQQAQQDTSADALASGVDGAIVGATAGTYGDVVEARTGADLGVLGSPGQSAVAGIGVGILASVVGQAGRRGQKVAAETRKTLLKCLEGRGYSVLE